MKQEICVTCKEKSRHGTGMLCTDCSRALSRKRYLTKKVRKAEIAAIQSEVDELSARLLTNFSEIVVDSARLDQLVQIQNVRKDLQALLGITRNLVSELK